MDLYQSLTPGSSCCQEGNWSVTLPPAGALALLLGAGVEPDVVAAVPAAVGPAALGVAATPPQEATTSAAVAATMTRHVCEFL